MDKKMAEWTDNLHDKHIIENYELLHKISAAEYSRGYKTGYRKALKDAEEKMSEVVDKVVSPLNTP
jgi:hypothetical protein